ncbi:ABC transporter permease [Paenibacillus sp. FSL H3-0333]|uniref:ABC transporter permease n=1 Tax=Paenibacillus sp. FSL H3-0333 TaxID=2921373 RepID=UPI0030FB95A5
MVKLISYEWQKHFRKGTIIIAILLFSIMNIGKIYSIYEREALLSNPGWKELYAEQYHTFGGRITNAKIKQLMTIYQPMENQTAEHTLSSTYRPEGTWLSNVYEDWNFFRYCFVYPMKYNYDYKAYASNVVIKAKENSIFFKSFGNLYESRKNEVIARIFHGRDITSFSDKEMYRGYVQYEFSSLLVLLLCMYGLISVFLSEKETEMDSLLMTTKTGGFKVLYAKLWASGLFICLISIWFWFLDYTTFYLIYGSKGGSSSPLYALEDFVHTPLNISLGQYALLYSFFKTMGMIVAGLSFLFISNLFRNALIPFLSGLTLIIVCTYMQEAFAGPGHMLLKLLNPFVLVVNRDLFRKAEFIALLGYPIPSYIAAGVLTVSWGIVFLYGIKLSAKKNAMLKGSRKRVNSVI